MKITVLRSDLLPALVACAAVAESRSPLVANACVLLSTAGHELTLRSSGGFQTVAVDIPLKDVKADGSALVKAEALLSRVEAMLDGEISISVTDRALELRRGTGRFSLALFDPKLVLVKVPPRLDGGKTSAPTFAGLISRVAVAMDPSVERPQANCMRLVADGKRLTATAWNNLSVARASIPLEASFDAVLSGASVRQLQKLIGKAKGDVCVGVVGSDLVLTSETMTYTSRLIGTVFPAAVDHFIPQPGGPVLRLDRDDFRGCIAAMRAGELDSDRVLLRTSPGGVQLIGRSAAGEDAEQFAAGEGQLHPCSFDAGQLAAAAAFYDGDTIEFWQRDPDADQRRDSGQPKPLAVRKPDSDDVYVVMPRLLTKLELEPAPLGAAA